MFAYGCVRGPTSIDNHPIAPQVKAVQLNIITCPLVPDVQLQLMWTVPQVPGLMLIEERSDQVADRHCVCSAEVSTGAFPTLGFGARTMRTGVTRRATMSFTSPAMSCAFSTVCSVKYAMILASSDLRFAIRASIVYMYRGSPIDCRTVGPGASGYPRTT